MRIPFLLGLFDHMLTELLYMHINTEMLVILRMLLLAYMFLE